MDLVRELTEIGGGATWTARDDNPPFNFGAVLAPSDTEEAPVAWARVLLPESLTQQYGRGARCAYLVLYVEPRTVAGTAAPAASLVSWHQRISGALKLPAALAAFLVNDLGLSTADDPAAEVGGWLKAPHALTELEIMPHCVALPWDTKTGFPPAAGVVRVAGGWGLCGDRARREGGRRTVVPACRPSSPLALGPFEAVN
jgi:hypothetical protein